MTTELQHIVPVAQFIGLAGAGCLTGLIASFSVFGVPATLLAPTELAVRQWRSLYKSGKASMPPFAIACSTAFAFLAFHTRGTDGRLPVSPSALYTTAAVTLPLIVPYTFGVMIGDVHALEAKDDKVPGAPDDHEVQGIIENWSRHNLVRALIAATGAILGGTAILSS